jgi:hypothetical protein
MATTAHYIDTRMNSAIPAQVPLTFLFRSLNVGLCYRNGPFVSAGLISYAVWLYFRFPLSLRMVEEMLAALGISVTYETIRQWGA